MVKGKKFRPDHKAVLDRMLLEIPGVTGGIIFGLSCYKVKGKVFATLWGEGVGLKVPEGRARELLQQPEFEPFCPFGRNRGKEFVQLTYLESQDYLRERALFLEAIAYACS